MFTCADCKTLKPEGDFTSSQLKTKSHRCRACVRQRNLNYQTQNKDKVRAYRQKFYSENREELLTKNRVYQQTRKDIYEPARRRWAETNREKMLTYHQDKGSAFREFTDSLKENLPCVDCGVVYAPYIMEYDHVTGDKRFNIGKMANHKRDRVLEEIQKCELVCCACHRIRSHARRPEPTTPKLVKYHEWLAPKKALPCSDCGRALAPEAMDFDHINEDKTAGVASMWSWGRQKVEAELAKCELVCANCHRERTVSRLRSTKGEQ